MFAIGFCMVVVASILLFIFNDSFLHYYAARHKNAPGQMILLWAFYIGLILVVASLAQIAWRLLP